MKLRLWWIPLLLALAPLLGHVPEPRDVPGFFAPIRAHTARRLLQGQAPWLNGSNGCTEAWFANPETGVLYPPAWIHLVLGPAAGLSLEIGLHLALLALGIGVLSGRLGAGPAGVAVAEAATWSSGAVLATVGMLNNLEALVWVPWMILAARSPRRWTVPATAAACAMGWLAGEPVVWALGVFMAIALAGSRQRAALAGVGLSLLLVAVQLVPFVAWVLEGDRGGGAAIQYLSGSVSPLGWTRVLVPGVPEAGPGTPWAASLFLGAPLLLIAVLGIGRRLWIAGLCGTLAVLASLPALGAGQLYLVLTRSLIRYPSRFAVLALVLLLPLAGAGFDRWLRGEGRRLAAALGFAALALLVRAQDMTGALAVAIPAGLLVAAAFLPKLPWLRSSAVIAGLLAAVVAGWPLLGFRQAGEVAWPWPETVGSGRVYTPPPSAPVRAWLAGAEKHLSLWPQGYHNLDAGASLVRSDAPLIHRRLQLHLDHADRGPLERWWLDTLAAPWMMLANAPPTGQGFRPIRTEGGMWLISNSRARPWITAWTARPARDVSMAPATVTVMRPQPERFDVGVRTGGSVWLSLAVPPVRGWRFSLDGRPVVPTSGPGILQLVPIPPGTHRLQGRYRPPGFPLTPVLSGCAVLLTLLLALVAWSSTRRTSTETADVAS